MPNKRRKKGLFQNFNLSKAMIVYFLGLAIYKLRVNRSNRKVSVNALIEQSSVISYYAETIIPVNVRSNYINSVTQTKTKSFIDTSR